MSGKQRKKFVPSFGGRGVDEAAITRMWKLLKSAIDHIHRQDASSLSFEELYRAGYNLVLNRKGDMLYKNVCITVEDHLKGIAKAVASTSDTMLLDELHAAWKLHKVTIGKIRDVLMYLDRIHVPKTKQPGLYDMGLKLFREVVVKQDSVLERLQQLLLDGIMRERQGEVVDKPLIKNTLVMLVDLGINSTSVYDEQFEVLFLSQTEAFYKDEAQRFISENTCPEYLFKAEARIAQERQRVVDYLNDTTAAKLFRIVDRELIATHAVALVEMRNSGLITMLRDNKVDDLKRMFQLFKRVPDCVPLIRDTMATHIAAEGGTLVTDSERAKSPVEFVQRLLDMRDKYDAIMVRSFESDKSFNRVLKSTFEAFMNKDTRCAQFLSTYVDELLRHGIKGMQEVDVDATLDKVVVIFRYLQDKDIFESFYKSHLQKRLLGGKSVSDEWERSMIAKLKTECGFQFTAKLEGMFQDVRLSKELMESFYKDAAAVKACPIQLGVTVLTTGFWPAQPVQPCNLPQKVQDAAASFHKFYLGQHTGRRLTWQTNRGNADVRATYGSKHHMLTVSTYQMCILMLFNQTDTLTFGEIMAATAIPTAECKRHLLSLTAPRNRILLKLCKGRDIAAADAFQFNPKFTSKYMKVKVPLVSARSVSASAASAASTKVPEPVEEARRHLIEAAVVRIMKTRKTLDHNNLVAEVTKQLASRFRPSPHLIKRRIESLIEREYLERSPQDRRLYNYLA